MLLSVFFWNVGTLSELKVRLGARKKEEEEEEEKKKKKKKRKDLNP